MVVLDSVKQAHERIRPYATLTPLAKNRILSLLLGTHVYVKMEIFQNAGSYKFRGALNKQIKPPQLFPFNSFREPCDHPNL
jgi:threonine dehydratase